MGGLPSRSRRTRVALSMMMILLVSALACTKRHGAIERNEESKAPPAGGKPTAGRQPSSSDGKENTPVDGPEDRADVPLPVTGTYLTCSDLRHGGLQAETDCTLRELLSREPYDLRRLKTRYEWRAVGTDGYSMSDVSLRETGVPIGPHVRVYLQGDREGVRKTLSLTHIEFVLETGEKASFLLEAAMEGSSSSGLQDDSTSDMDVEDPYDKAAQGSTGQGQTNDDSSGKDQQGTTDDQEDPDSPREGTALMVSMTPGVNFLDADEYRVKFAEPEAVEDTSYRIIPPPPKKPSTRLTADGGAVIEVPEDRAEVRFKWKGRRCRVEIPLRRLATPNEHRAFCDQEVMR